MAKDITVRVTGQNPDGTMNISVPDGTNNPFMPSGGQSGAMVPYNPSAATGYKARIGTTEVMFQSEADFLKADKAFREQVASSTVPTLGGGSPVGGGSWLRTGASVGEAAAAYFNGRAIRKRMVEVDDALDAQRDALNQLAQLQSKYPELVPVLRMAFQAERDATLATQQLLEDQLLAVDIQTGAGVARVVSDLWEGNASNPSFMSGSATSPVLAGGIGLGLGLLLSRDNTDDRRRRR
ncbi:MAG: hypothetical protein JNM40_00810 [Myxococcales bacterium]|nr:hypothetical protein [Myxococcales bacterium]